jgi:membrane protein implicated in regulation of membrane protease activity
MPMLLFWLVFGLFIAATLVWAVLTVRWAVRRNRELKKSQGDAQLS